MRLLLGLVALTVGGCTLVLDPPRYATVHRDAARDRVARDADDAMDVTDGSVAMDATAARDVADAMDAQDERVRVDVATSTDAHDARVDTGFDVALATDGGVAEDVLLVGDGGADVAVIACSVSCPAGLSCCAGACVDLRTDENACGVCGVRCGDGLVCQGGACRRCTLGLSLCGASERCCFLGLCSGILCL